VIRKKKPGQHHSQSYCSLAKAEYAACIRAQTIQRSTVVEKLLSKARIKGQETKQGETGKS
jgi:hypothetical protein